MAGIEARGFLFAAAVAFASGTGVVPVRKAGKLPWRTVSAAYELEYGEATSRCTRTPSPSTAGAAGRRRAGHRRHRWPPPPIWSGGPAVELVGVSVVVELTALGGRDRLADLDVQAVLAG